MVKVYKSEAGKERVLRSYNKLLLEYWPAEMQELKLATKYGITHCITAGNPANPPLMLLHGVGDNSAVMWMLNIRELAQYYYCIAVDTLGGPGKSIPNGNYTKQSFNQVDWINEIADQLRLGRFYLAGVSNGAYMAYNYTINESGRVINTVCMEGGMVSSPLKAMVRTLMMMFPEILVPTHRNLLKVARKLSSPASGLFDHHPEVGEHLVLLMKNHNQQAMFVHKLQLYDKAQAVAVRDKLYFLLGDYKLEHKREFTAILEDGGFHYTVIPDAGHGINHEQPERINRELIGFLKDHIAN
ncbi:alpha/beta hydrolase [Paenibacillus sp. MMS20-IR301]|uniref:alpha/beta fold hydrolase n=1 Tax=Paenibacillus sp. MMS20-IR301 TaxID=2895946 RepID=UPI0028F0DD7A|nr:alpha/beta hydrolase [Paenibacillus sp. MMS20-IR301]WNS46572.1 alpha/beta hydrolase [Paenibacillus sp. MMS20-IR301]